MISGFLLLVAGGLGLSFRGPIADFKHGLDEAWNVDIGTADGYRYGVAVLSGVVMVGGLLLVLRGYLHAQDYLPIDVIRQNNGIDPGKQVDLAAKLTASPQNYFSSLAWRGFPTSSQLYETCNLIFESFLNNKPKDGVASGKQLAFLIWNFYHAGSIQAWIAQQLAKPYPPDAAPTETIENAFKFLRQWCEFHFPRYLTALERIQQSVFERKGLQPGDYTPFAAMVRQQFMHPAVTLLEEYGLPGRVTQQILEKSDLGNETDEILLRLREIDAGRLRLSRFEKEMLEDTLYNL